MEPFVISISKCIEEKLFYIRSQKSDTSVDEKEEKKQNEVKKVS